jgi:hypothetical protein
MRATTQTPEGIKDLQRQTRELARAYPDNIPRIGSIGNLGLNFSQDSVIINLRGKIYRTELTVLVRTIEKETNELWHDLKDKTYLQNSMVYYCVNYMGDLDRYLSNNILDVVIKFLKQNGVNIFKLKSDDVHRIIMILATKLYDECGNKTAKKIWSLIGEMDLVK